jgi:putative heme transporter
MADPQRFELHIPTITIVKILVTVLLLFILVRLWTPFLLLIVAVLLAVTFDSFVVMMERRSIPRQIGVLVVGLIMLVLIVLLFGVVLPAMFTDIAALLVGLEASWGQLRKGALSHYPSIRHVIDAMFSAPNLDVRWLQTPLIWAQATIEATGTMILILVLSLYLLLDGRRLYAWMLSYAPRKHRAKVAETLPEVQAVIREYMRGQLLISCICGLWVFVVLTAVGVPAALPLAFLAAVFDILPILGTILMTIPAVLMALSVSGTAAIVVLIAYLLYHVLENYIIVPRIYGRNLRLSPLAVLLALIVGGSLQGILGILLALPIVAAYPIIERIWLQDYMGSEVIAAHAALAGATDTQAEDAAVDEVLHGR